MRYSGNICDGCKKPLQDDEDIVVCPECATPQHRECYEDRGECVNSHLHGSGYVWKGKVSKRKVAEISTLLGKKDSEEDIICPNCSHANPPGSDHCRNCSMKFTMFGVNIVQAAQKEEQKYADAKKDDAGKPHPTAPTYEAPFKIGEGEGFDNSAQQDESDPTQRPEGTNPWNLGGYEDYEEINTFKGPFPVEDYTAGVRTNTLGSFIRNNAQSYINKFKWGEIKGKNGFNWAAFLFAPYWFFYRKLYKPGIIFITLQTVMSILITPVLTPFMEFYEYLLTLDLETLSEQMLFELSDHMTAMLTEISLPLTIFSFAALAMHLISGFIANGMYKKYCIKNINLGLQAKPVQEKIRFFAKYGGASFLLVFAAYFAETLLSMLVSYLMY